MYKQCTMDIVGGRVTADSHDRSHLTRYTFFRCTTPSLFIISGRRSSRSLAATIVGTVALIDSALSKSKPYFSYFRCAVILSALRQQRTMSRKIRESRRTRSTRKEVKTFARRGPAPIALTRRILHARINHGVDEAATK